MRAVRYLAVIIAVIAAAVAVGAALAGPAGDRSSSVVGIGSEAAGPIDESPTTSAPTSATASSTPASTTAATTAEPAGAEAEGLALPSAAADMIPALDQAEAAIRDPELTDEQLDAWGRRQQALYRHLSFNPTWVDEVLAGVDPANAESVALNWQARQSLTSLVNTEEVHAELPAWRVVAPLPADELIGYYKAAEAESGIEWEFLAAINLVETRMGRIEGVSTAGALGPMQFLPTTWAECCEGDPTVAADAIAGAARYLTIRGGPENMDRAIWGYNNSDYYVDAVTSYATVMMADERAYWGYHAWEIYFRSTEGLIRIPVGYEQLEPIPATEWLADNPETLFSGPGG